MCITQAELKSLLRYEVETGCFYWLTDKCKRKIKAGDRAGHKKVDGYRILAPVGRKAYREHRLAWLYVYGTMPTGEIDHINGLKDDNRIKNLRIATRSENMQNLSLSSKGKTGMRGAYPHNKGGKFFAKIFIDGKTIYLGTFDTAMDAHEAYKIAKSVVHKYNNH